MDVLGLYANRLLAHLLQVLLDHLGGHGDNVLALPVLDEVKRLQGADDVLGLDAGHVTHILDGEVAAVLP